MRGVQALYFCVSSIFIRIIVVYVCICFYIAIYALYMCVYRYIEMKYLRKHAGVVKNYIAVFHVPLDSDCCTVCLSFVLQSLLYSIYLALGTII